MTMLYQPTINYVGNVEPSSPPGPEYDDERDMLLGNNDNIDEEEEGEELFDPNFDTRSV